MKMLRIVAAGAVSYLAWRAWKHSRDTDARIEGPEAVPLPDAGTRTAPHGDPILSDEAGTRENADTARTAPQTTTH